MSRIVAVPFAALAACLMASPVADAQGVLQSNIPGTLMPGGVSNWGSVYAGQAEVIRAQGDYLIARQKALSMYQDLRVKKLEVRKAELLQMEWLQDFRHQWNIKERQRTQEAKLIGAMDATPNEIISGYALNVLLDKLTKDGDTFSANNSRPLDSDQVKYLNFTGVRADSGNFGVLLRGKPVWPMYLRGTDYAEHRRKIERGLDKLVQDTLKGEQEAREEDYIALQEAVDELAEYVRVAPRRYNPDATGLAVKGFSFRYWSAARDYVKQLDQACAALNTPNAASMLQRISATNVSGLVTEMKTRGIRFAPAMRGDEAAYMSVYQQMRLETRAGQ